MNNYLQLSNKKRNQQGLSLIELMISMVVGLFMLAGVVTNFVSTKDSDRMRVAVGEIDSTAAFALKELRNTIIHTGYTTTNNVNFYNDKVFFTPEDSNLPESSSCSLNQIQKNINNFKTRDVNGQYAARDILTVVYLADNPCVSGVASCTGANNTNINPQALVYTDCAGGGEDRDVQTVSCSTDPSVNTDINKAKIYNSFVLTKNTNSKFDRTLMCYGSRGGREEIVGNIEAIQYLYGVKEEQDGEIAYRVANQVENNNQWGMVRSIKVGLLVRSTDKNLVNKTTAKTQYNILGTKVKIANSDLGRLFRVYTTTINLENLDKGPLG